MKVQSLPLVGNAPPKLQEEFRSHPLLSVESLGIPAAPIVKKYEILALRKDLSAKYSKDVVDKVFKQIAKLALTHIPEPEVQRIELCCHFFDLQKEVAKSLKTEDKKATRVFNRYMSHTRGEMTSRLNYKYKGALPTHEEIDQIKTNYKAFFEMIPQFLERYDEWTCHRALNHTSILSSDTLTGKETLPSFEDLSTKVEAMFEKEQQLVHLMEVMPYEQLNENYEVLLHQIYQLKDPYAKVTLEKELLYRLGKLGYYKSNVSEEQIKAYAQLFHASFDGTKWAENEEKLTPLDPNVVGNVNDVYFLRSSLESKDLSNNLLKQENNGLVAVFKAPFKGNEQSGAMESFAYDVSQIFGLSSGLVPTKQKKLKGMEGSIQVFQDGLSWSDLSKMTKAEQSTVIKGISMRSFLEALLPILVLGNRDVHADNFFFVKKKDDEYGIVVFDNEFCFQYSNYILTGYTKKKKGDPIELFSKPMKKKESPEFKSLVLKSDKKEEKKPTSSSLDSPKNSKEATGFYQEDTIVKESILPIRCAIFALPHADTVITGEDKAWLKKLISTWPKSFEEFLKYLNSPPGKAKLNKLPGKSLSQYQIKAFNERLHKLMKFISSDKDYTPRDLLIRIFPLYPAFYNLTKMLYPTYTEFALGAKPAEHICHKAIHEGLISQETGDKFLSEIYKCEVRA